MRHWSESLRQRALVLLVGVLCALALAEGLRRTGVLDWADDATTDVWFQLAGVRKTPRHVALVVIDDASFAEFSSEPLAFWSPHFAKAITTLKAVGVPVVGVDILFGSSPTAWMARTLGELNPQARSYDAAFQGVLQTGAVVLSGVRYSGGAGQADGLFLPHPDYLFALPGFNLKAHVALANLDDVNAVVRLMAVAPSLHLPPAQQRDSHPVFSMAALLALRANGLDTAASQWTVAGRPLALSDAPTAIAYAGPPGTVPRLPFRALMQPGAADDPQVRALAGKVVILATDDGGDRHMTPYARRFFGLAPRLMNGAEIHANATEMLLSGERLLPAPDAARWVLGVVLFAALGLALLAGGWLWPIGGLVAAIVVSAVASRLAFGQLLLLLPVASVQASLVVLAIGLALYRALYENRRRERMQGLFGRYVSDQVVQELVRSGSEPALGGELRTVTVLFCDIQKFSTMSEALTPQQVVGLLNTYLGAAANAVDAEGGTLDKFTGDGLMAVFGAPATYPDHAARAVRAAQAMDRAAREAAKHFDPMLTGLGLTPFRVGLGLHTGQAVLGSIGSTKRSEYTAIGDAVNVAARVEGLSRELGATIVLTRETWEASGAQVSIGPWHNMQVKGRRAEVQVAAVLDTHGDKP